MTEDEKDEVYEIGEFGGTFYHPSCNLSLNYILKYAIEFGNAKAAENILDCIWVPKYNLTLKERITYYQLNL